MIGCPKPIKVKVVKDYRLKRTPIKQVSKKQTKELALRSKLKAELIAELPEDGAGRKICPQKCEGCNRVDIEWPGWNLIHKKPLGRGGKTERANVTIGCQRYHAETYHGAHYGRDSYYIRQRETDG